MRGWTVFASFIVFERPCWLCSVSPTDFLIPAHLVPVFLLHRTENFVSFLVFLVSRHASSDWRARGVHPPWRWLGLGGGRGGLHLHRLLLRLPQIHHRVLQRDRGHLRRHTQSGVLDLLHHAGCHVRRRWVVITASYVGMFLPLNRHQ